MRPCLRARRIPNYERIASCDGAWFQALTDSAQSTNIAITAVAQRAITDLKVFGRCRYQFHCVTET